MILLILREREGPSDNAYWLAPCSALTPEQIAKLAGSTWTDRINAGIPGCTCDRDLGLFLETGDYDNDGVWTWVFEDKIGEVTERHHCKVLHAYYIEHL